MVDIPKFNTSQSIDEQAQMLVDYARDLERDTVRRELGTVTTYNLDTGEIIDTWPAPAEAVRKWPPNDTSLLTSADWVH